MPGLPHSYSTNSTFSIKCQEIINAVEFSPFEKSSNLIAYGGNNKVSLGVCQFGDEADSDTGFHFKHVADFHHGTRTQGIVWSPRSSSSNLPASVQFCTIGGDKKLRHFTTFGADNTSVKVLGGHTGYVNACVFEPITGEQAASVSDDHTCRLWDLEKGVQKTCIPLGSAGMAVGWNPYEPNKLMVAENNGVIRFYDLVSQQPIMSLSVGRVPLIDAHWCPTDPLKVGAVALDDWYIWDMSKSSCVMKKDRDKSTNINEVVGGLKFVFTILNTIKTIHLPDDFILHLLTKDILKLSLPEITRQAHPEGVCHFRWANQKSLFATSGRPGNQVKVYHIGHQKLPVSCDLKVGGGLSWHHSLPLCASGDDRKVHIWAVEV